MTTNATRAQGYINGSMIQLYVSDCPNCGVIYGVCPVGNCRRHFNDVQAHIKTQHKSWAAEHPEVLSGQSVPAPVAPSDQVSQKKEGPHA